MDEALKILIIIVSSTLIVFLVVTIIAIIKIIQILRSLKQIAQKAEKIADSAESVSEFFRKSAAPLQFGRFVTNVVETVMHKKGKKEQDHEK